jgi:hypothetical protein
MSEHNSIAVATVRPRPAGTPRGHLVVQGIVLGGPDLGRHLRGGRAPASAATLCAGEHGGCY